MIKGFSVTTARGLSKAFTLHNYDLTPYMIVSIDGLDPPDVVVNTIEGGSYDGSTYNSSKLSPRSISISLAFLNDATVEIDRNELYKYFPVKEELRLDFQMGSGEYYIYGYVKSIEISIFTTKQSANIVIECPKPSFKRKGSHTSTFSGIIKRFSFPFSNPSLTEKQIIFGEIVKATRNSIYYTGNLTTYPVIRLMIYKNLSFTGQKIYIFNETFKASLTIDGSKLTSLDGFKTNDVITIDSRIGSKGITLRRDAKDYNILNSVSEIPNWFILAPGDNVFSMDYDDAYSTIDIKIDYEEEYSGI